MSPRARKPLAFGAVLALTTAAPWVASGCADESIVVATIPEGEEGGIRPSLVRCAHASDCPAGSYCDKHACGETAGVCTAFPSLCQDTEEPVCGCDGITYFNDCLRRAAGVPSSVPRECDESAVVCGGFEDIPCPKTAVCAKLLGFEGLDTCLTKFVAGSCWVLPAKCPEKHGPDLWDGCDDDHNGLVCQSTCAAIRSGRAHVRASFCP